MNRRNFLALPIAAAVTTSNDLTPRPGLLPGDHLIVTDRPRICYPEQDRVVVVRLEWHRSSLAFSRDLLGRRFDHLWVDIDVSVRGEEFDLMMAEYIYNRMSPKAVETFRGVMPYRAGNRYYEERRTT